ncbi:hypothetical protein ACFWNT_48000, partial [Streptomyces sp. NPDC058409]|uniref:hypothetical protein n=1 Tax=Streptomyces sp. NPDC058409 TaxID=3346484 RepID=UPI0036570113
RTTPTASRACWVCSRTPSHSAAVRGSWRESHPKVTDNIEMLDTPEAMKLSGPASSGPFPLLQVLNVHLREEFGVMNLVRGEFARFQGQGRHFHDAMDWLTAESENQSYEQT